MCTYQFKSRNDAEITFVYYVAENNIDSVVLGTLRIMAIDNIDVSVGNMDFEFEKRILLT